MATLLLTAVGTAVGGPFGGAIGTLLGQQVDRAIFGSGSREGPRLKELAITTSSYGQPIPRHFGRMRVGGSVVWATDLVESSSTQGGKGKPKTTTYSYAANFAVALSSVPLARIGRIWADGNLLRGINDDLKVEGQMRFYLGTGDAPVDPLIAADKGADATAFRDCAYVVFEGLQLADFGNRIPTLTFEVFSNETSRVSLGELVPSIVNADSALLLGNTRGFSDEGGALASTLSSIDRVFPLTCATTSEGLRIDSAITIPDVIVTLPEQLSPQNSQDANERHSERGEALGQVPLALRYYDEERDYQPGVQRAQGVRPEGREVMIDLPATITATGAKQLANDNARRARWMRERKTWRIGELDPSLGVGSIVALPGQRGIWRIDSWEWYDRGIELGLHRITSSTASNSGSYTGAASIPADRPITPTQVELFEVPPTGATNPSSPTILAALTSQSDTWNGAALFSVQGNSLLPIGTSSARRAFVGKLASPLSTSSAMLFEPNAKLDVSTTAQDIMLEDTDISGLTWGANRLLVGSEVVQYLSAQLLSPGSWRLHGLLRGRAGTESAALQGHPQGTAVVALDDRLTEIDPAQVRSEAETQIAAIGRGDPEPVFAQLANAGLSRRPLSPVHPKITVKPDSSWQFCWTRRARGQWHWEGQGEVPLIEEAEQYLVGYGPVANPFAVYSIGQPNLTLSSSERDSLVASYGSTDLWVQQVGTYSSSPALLLTTLS